MDLERIPTPGEMAELCGADLDRALVDLEFVRRTLEAAYVAVLDRADSTGHYRADGHASVRGWSTALTNASPVETKRRLQSMRALRELPEVARHLADGAIGVEQVREIAQLYANPRLRELVVDGDRRLVEHSEKDFASFAEVLHRWAQFGDPRGAEQRHAETHEGRDAMVFERDGVVHLHAKCGTGQGAALMEIFQRQCDAEFVTDWEQAQAAGDDLVDDRAGDPMARLPRTDAQRRMDGLHRLIVRGVAASPDAQTPEPLVNIVMTKAEYDAGLTEMLGGTVAPAATVDDVDAKRCETTTGLTIPHPRRGDRGRSSDTCAGW